VDTTEDSVVLTSLVVVYLKGVAMGAADAVPGVSGGTIALITGIYERLIAAVTTLDPSIALQIPYLYQAETRAKLKRSLLEMDVPFLLALGTGMATAIIVLARVVQVALDTVPGPTFAFFFGLIGASAIVLSEPRWLFKPGPVAAGVVGFTLAFVIAGETATETATHSLPIIFGAGVFAISGMILPGVSGAFILLLLGQYDYMTASLNGTIDGLIGLASGESAAEFVEAVTAVSVFMAGAVVGLFSIAFIVRAALERYRTATFAFLVSLMIGALRYPAIQILETTDTWNPMTVTSVLGAGIVGLATVLLLDRYTQELDYQKEDATANSGR
jgi:putative membrane protein